MASRSGSLRIAQRPSSVISSVPPLIGARGAPAVQIGPNVGCAIAPPSHPGPVDVGTPASSSGSPNAPVPPDPGLAPPAPVVCAALLPSAEPVAGAQPLACHTPAAPA